MENFTCPDSGPGSWHACAGGSRFVGCCTRDPCDLGCNAGDLTAASFSPALHGDIPDLECTAPGAQFYTCNTTTPPFWGCCKSDPCKRSDGACPRADLSPAALGNNPVVSLYYAPTGVASSSGSSPSSSSTAVVVTTSSSKQSDDDSASSSNSKVIAAAVGGAVGSAILTCLLVLLLVWRLRKRQGDHRGEGEKDRARFSDAKEEEEEEEKVLGESPEISPQSATFFSPGGGRGGGSSESNRHYSAISEVEAEDESAGWRRYNRVSTISGGTS